MVNQKIIAAAMFGALALHGCGSGKDEVDNTNETQGDNNNTPPAKNNPVAASVNPPVTTLDAEKKDVENLKQTITDLETKITAAEAENKKTSTPANQKKVDDLKADKEKAEKLLKGEEKDVSEASKPGADTTPPANPFNKGDSLIAAGSDKKGKDDKGKDVELSMVTDMKFDSEKEDGSIAIEGQHDGKSITLTVAKDAIQKVATNAPAPAPAPAPAADKTSDPAPAPAKNKKNSPTDKNKVHFESSSGDEDAQKKSASKIQAGIRGKNARKKAAAKKQSLKADSPKNKKNSPSNFAPVPPPVPTKPKLALQSKVVCKAFTGKETEFNTKEGVITKISADKITFTVTFADKTTVSGKAANFALVTTAPPPVPAKQKVPPQGNLAPEAGAPAPAPPATKLKTAPATKLKTAPATTSGGN